MDYKKLLGDNYKEDMTAEQILEALDKLEVEDKSADLEKYKNLVSKANSEAASYKKQLKEKMTEDELKADEIKELRDAYDLLKREKELETIKAKVISLGYDEDLATKTSQALIDGEFLKVLDYQKEFNNALEKKVKQDLLRNTHKPDGTGDPTKTMTKEQFLKLSLEDRHKFSIEHPDQYREIYKGD